MVLDGILCHNGKVHNKSLEPSGIADWETFEFKKEEIQNKGGDDIFPLTLEGCVVRFADTIAYLGRDLKDALEVELISEDLPDFPRNCRELFGYEPGNDINWIIMDTLVKDLINNSFGKNILSFSDDVSQCIRDCKEYNMKHIYGNPLLVQEKKKMGLMYKLIFENFLTDILEEKTGSLIYSDILDLKWISPVYRETAVDAEIVRDFIAGMTDRYFESMFNKITVPQRVKGRYGKRSTLL